MGFHDQDEAYPYATIGTDQAKRMIESGAHVVDVRRPEEWNQGHIAQATLVPVEVGIYAFGKALQELQLPAEEDVIFVCASGRRSALASEIALLTGLKRVYNLANGMNGWVDSNYPVER
ncbi:MAG: rhodanese-like domain-containing protein [Ktedonobacteraceae bacterium]|nr:rhodanese-like domain-containing protein [Ktedonobacteraceae bacterium]MBO0794944.1 rhodanese-like domain-containing protein [Ktedonobacteraceae bacterium]